MAHGRCKSKAWLLVLSGALATPLVISARTSFAGDVSASGIAPENAIHAGSPEAGTFAMWLPAVLQTSQPTRHSAESEWANELGGVQALAVHGDGSRAYAAQGNHVTVIDISEVGHPREVGRIWLGPNAGTATVQQLRVSGDRLYAAMGKEGMAIIDLRDSSIPSVVGWLQEPVNRLAVSGNVVVATHIVYGGCDNQSCGSVITVDVSQPAQPRVLDTLSGNPPGKPACGFTDVDVDGALAFVSVDVCGLFVLDISDPANIVIVFGDYCDCIMDANYVRVDGGMLYLAGQDGPSINMAAADRPGAEFLGTFRYPIVFADGSVWEPEALRALEVDDSIFFVAGRFDSENRDASDIVSNGVWIVNVADPGSPTVTDIAETGAPTSLAITRDAVLVSDSRGVSIFAWRR
jgi:hypothetical protein